MLARSTQLAYFDSVQLHPIEEIELRKSQIKDRAATGTT